MFQWDDAKAVSNFAKHGVTFEAACRVFQDPFAIDQCDGRFDLEEDRYTVVGLVDDRVLYVAYTMRGDDIRIISARGAEAYERRRYYDDNRHRER